MANDSADPQNPPRDTPPFRSASSAHASPHASAAHSLAWGPTGASATEDPRVIKENDPEAVQLATADLSPFVSDQMRRRIVSMATHAIMTTSAGTRLDRGKLETLIESTFRLLCDGQAFDFAPVLAALLRVKGMTEEDIYIGALNLRTLLAAVGVSMQEVRWTLTPEMSRLLIDQASRATLEAQAARETATTSAPTHRKRLRLGELLVNEGYLLPEDLDDALGFQKAFGGRLGSNLVQLGLITEQDLAQFLGRQFNTTCCLSEREINAIPDDVLAIVPREIAQTHRVIPVGVEKRRLRLAMVDPSDVSVIDDVSHRTGRAIVPVVAPEFVITYGLEKKYGIRQATRLLMMLPKRSDSSQSALQAAPGTAATPATPATPATTTASATANEVFRFDPKTFSELAIDLIDALEEVDIYNLVFDLFARSFPRVVFCRYEAGSVRCWLRSTPQTGRSFVKRTYIPLDGGVLSRLELKLSPDKTRLGPTTEDAALRAVLECEENVELLALPFQLAGSASGFLLAEASGNAANSLALPTLQAVVTMTNAALERTRLRAAILEAVQSEVGSMPHEMGGLPAARRT